MVPSSICPCSYRGDLIQCWQKCHGIPHSFASVGTRACMHEAATCYYFSSATRMCSVDFRTIRCSDVWKEAGETGHDLMSLSYVLRPILFLRCISTYVSSIFNQKPSSLCPTNFNLPSQKFFKPQGTHADMLTECSEKIISSISLLPSRLLILSHIILSILSTHASLRNR
jgi:hypothetical protein